MTAVVPSLATAIVFSIVEMGITWWVARQLRNNGIVDAVWAAGFAAIVGCLHGVAWFRGAPRPAADLPFLLLTVLVALWSGRLALHLAVRVRSHHPREDVRYAALRQEWGAQVDRKMFWFFQLQGMLQVVLATPFVVVAVSGMTDPQRHLHPAHWAGAALWFLGWLGESIADAQLAAFRRDPARRHGVCQDGLWRYSRHPNYFSEWLIWLGYAVFALGTDSVWSWTALVAPALMYHFLVNVTGIPMTEALSVQSRGDAYRTYQRTTSAFFPWPPKPDTGPKVSGRDSAD